MDQVLSDAYGVKAFASRIRTEIRPIAGQIISGLRDEGFSHFHRADGAIVGSKATQTLVLMPKDEGYSVVLLSKMQDGKYFPQQERTFDSAGKEVVSKRISYSYPINPRQKPGEAPVMPEFINRNGADPLKTDELFSMYGPQRQAADSYYARENHKKPDMFDRARSSCPA